MQAKSREQARYTHAGDLHGLECLQANFRRQVFNRHIHEGYCIGVIERGAQRFYRSGANHIAAQNSLILVNADQVHDGHTATEEGWAYQAIYPLPEMMKMVTSQLTGRAGGIPYFPEPVVYDPEMARQLRCLFHSLWQSNNHLQRQSLYYAALSQLILRHGRSRGTLPDPRPAPASVRRVREYLDAHYADNLSLDQLAGLVELNPFYLTRLFSKTVGLPPHRYQLQRRLQNAKRFLRSNLTLADIAIETGFTDQSHLSRHFKRNFGVSPGQYRRECC